MSYECLLMDDASTDDGVRLVHQQFPSVRIIEHHENLGFGAMVNEGASLASGEILFLINNDLIVRPDFVSRLFAHFADDGSLFGVSAKTVDWDQAEPNHVNMTARFIAGQMRLAWSDDSQISPTMFLQGGSCAVRRVLFLKLGGFPNLFAPGYWEDYDISYQALKAGYHLLYDPAAVGAHFGQGSMIRAHGLERITFAKERNRLLFHALNLTDSDRHSAFWMSLPAYIRNTGDVRLKLRWLSVWNLFLKRRIIQQLRELRMQHQVVTDAAIFEKFKDKGQLC